MLVDSHCHIDFPELAENFQQLLDLMRENNVGCAVCSSVTLEDFPRVLALAEAHSHILATIGVHPETTNGREPTLDELIALAQHPKIIAIGQTGTRRSL